MTIDEHVYHNWEGTKKAPRVNIAYGLQYVDALWYLGVSKRHWNIIDILSVSQQLMKTYLEQWSLQVFIVGTQEKTKRSLVPDILFYVMVQVATHYRPYLQTGSLVDKKRLHMKVRTWWNWQRLRLSRCGVKWGKAEGRTYRVGGETESWKARKLFAPVKHHPIRSEGMVVCFEVHNGTGYRKIKFLQMTSTQ